MDDDLIPKNLKQIYYVAIILNANIDSVQFQKIFKT